MRIYSLHDWALSPGEAVQLQKDLARKVQLQPLESSTHTIAAVDVSFNLGGHWLFGAVVVVDRHDLTVIEQQTACEPMTFPYIPGLLSFREIPVLLKAFGKLQTQPDVVICDGQGIAHPRRLGIASHLGLWLGMPTIGCAKTLLCGTYEPPGDQRGDQAVIWDHGDKIGRALRTRSKVKPVFVSPGHLCDVEQAVDLILAVTPKYRLPEPIRQAHNLANEIRRQAPPERPSSQPEPL